MGRMENEYMKRGYLLPQGCKDLNDVLKLKQKRALSQLPYLPLMPAASGTPSDATLEPWVMPPPLPPVSGEIVVPPRTTVKKLATLLGKKPFEIIGDLMQFGMFATEHFLLDFDTVSRIARKYGLTAIRSVV
jgi:Translation initiation factor IF-2, N-terminal region